MPPGQQAVTALMETARSAVQRIPTAGSLKGLFRERPETLTRTKLTESVTGALLKKGKQRRALPSSIKLARFNGLETLSLAVPATPTKRKHLPFIIALQCKETRPPQAEAVGMLKADAVPTPVLQTSGSTRVP